MLKGISPVLGAEALWVLAAMGHGDDLALVDRNFPAAEVAARTVTGRLVRLAGVDATAAARAILSLFPIDGFADDPIRRMEVVGEPDTMLEVHREVLAEARGLRRDAMFRSPRSNATRSTPPPARHSRSSKPPKADPTAAFSSAKGSSSTELPTGRSGV